MADATGLDKALAGAVRAGRLPGEAEQIEMDAIAQLPLLGEVRHDGVKLKPGRPPGAMNKSTKELANYVLQRHRHPVIAAAQICDLPVTAVASALACTLLEAAEHQQRLREFVARYTLQAMPQSVQVDMGTVGMLMVVGMQHGMSEAQLRSAFGVELGQVQKIQEVNGGDRPSSDAGSSDETR
jgi:hypothetical protein